MKLVNSYNAVTITSDLTVDQVEDIMQYKPNALTLYDDKKPIFSVMYRKGSQPDAGPLGVVFTNHDADGKIFATFDTKLGGETTEAKASKLRKEFGAILAHLKEVEVQAAAALTEMGTMLDSVTDAIQINS